jgi:polygalacturonase
MKRGVVFILVWLAFADWVHAINPPLPTIPTNVFNVTNYGAIGNGTTDNTTAIANAISAATKAGGGTVEFPAAAGTYLSGPITLSSSINLQVDTGATLQMLPYGTYPSDSSQFIYCDKVKNLEISGGGIIDGQGQAWWEAYTNDNSLSRPLLLQLESCVGLYIHDITFQNPPYHHCGIRDNGGNITISNLTESAPAASPNTDGLDFVGTNCLIEDCHISVGDDNIALGSTGPLIGLVISNCAFGSGHGVSIGSTVTDGITNLTVINCTFNGTVNGIRMKCDQDASTTVINLNYLNLSMTNVQLPIVIYTYYNETGTPDNITPAEVLAASNTSPVNATTPKWSNITISNLNITSGSSSDIGGIIWGPTEWPISNLTLVCITNNAPNTFDLYNVYGVQIINSQFNFQSGDTFTLCNAGVTISNAVPGSGSVSIGGATSANSLALYNAVASMSSTNLFAANPITISSSVLANTSNLTLPGSTSQNFSLGTNRSAINVTGNLTLDSTLNIANAGGFTAANYTLFTYTGSLSGEPSLGATPTGFEGYTYNLSTNAIAKEVMLVVSPPSPPSFGTASYVSSSGNIIFSGTGGVSNGAYHVLTSTNISLPLNQWTSIATNQFNSNGNFIFTNSMQTNVRQRFFRLQLP